MRMIRTLFIIAVMSLVAIFALAGCGSNDSWPEAASDREGYRWVGSGEPGNFGSAYGFCRSTLGAETEGRQLQGSGGPVITTPGGPNTIPGYERSSQSIRSDVGNQRQFRGCMASQGWATADTAPPPPAK